MTTEPGKRIWFVRVEAIGDNTATGAPDRLYRWTSSDAPSWDTEGLYQHCLGEGIDIQSQSIEPRTGKASSGGMNFSLNIEKGDPHGVKSIFGRRYHTAIGNLSEEIGAADVPATIKLPGYTTGVAGDVVYINREAFKLGTHTGSGTYTGCTRAQLETRAQRHRVGVPAYANIKVLRARRVTLGYYDESATSYTDEVEFQSYQLWDGGQGAGTNIVTYNFECDGFTAVLSEAYLLKDQWIGRVTAFGGHSLFSDTDPKPDKIYFEWQSDYRDETRVRLPEQLRSARTAAKGGSADTRGGTGAEPVANDPFYISANGVVYVAYVDTIEIDSSNNVSQFTAAFLPGSPAFGGTIPNIEAGTDITSIDIRECFVSSSSGQDNNGAATAQLPLGSGGGHHPLTVWLQTATSTPDGANGAYDTGCDFGLRIPVSWIDLDAAQLLISTDPEQYNAERFFIGREDEPQAALEKMRTELLAIAGIQRTEATDGRISFTRITDSDYLTTAVAVGEDQLVISVELDESFRLANTLDKVLARYDRAGDGRSRRFPVHDNENIEESLGPVDTETIDGGSFQSRDLIVSAVIDYLVRWRTELPSLAFATTMDVNVRCGDGVNLTCLAVLGYDQTLDVVTEGVTDSRVLITSRQPDIEANMIVYTGLHLGIRGISAVDVAPAFNVLGAATGINVPVSATYYVQTDHIRGYTNDIDPWTVGDSAAVLNTADLSVKESGLVIASLVSGTVGLTGLTVALVSGDKIVPDTYAVSTSIQKSTLEYFDRGKQYQG